MRVIIKTELVGKHERKILDSYYKEATESEDVENMNEEDHALLMHRVLCKTLTDPRMARIKLDYNESEGTTSILFEFNLEKWSFNKQII